MLQKEVLNRLVLSRHLLQLALETIKNKNDIYLFSTANLLQDSVEAFLLGISSQVNANIKPNTNYENYFDEINKIITPNVLPFRIQLTRLNKIRVNSKHYGIQPPRQECESLLIVVIEFFKEVTYLVLNKDFNTLSCLDLIDECESKEYLLEAKNAIEHGDFIKCSIDCRKVIFVAIEKDYDISVFEKESNQDYGFIWSKAPFYTRNKEYIQKNVKEPSNYIVLDYSDIDQQLLKYNIDPNLFWNIWRLTPSVYRYKDKKEWIIKCEFNKMDIVDLEDKASYIFNSTVEIVLAIQAYNKKFMLPDIKFYTIELIGENIPVFEKADETSKITMVIPNTIKRTFCSHYTKGLKDNAFYYAIFHSETDPVIYGFVKDCNVQK